MPRLNGWQRLWILCAVTYAFLVGLVGYGGLDPLPTEDAIYQEWSDDLIAMVLAVDPHLKDVRPANLRAQYSQLTTKQLVDELTKRYADRPALDAGAFSDVPGRRDERSDSELVRLFDSGGDVTQLSAREAARLLSLSGWRERRPDTPTVSQLEQEYRDALTTLSERRRETTRQRRKDLLTGAALAWSAPMISLYAFGWAIAWVRRGFREKVG